jgi:hypothetical protein
MAEREGRAILAVDRVFAARLFTQVPASTIAAASGEGVSAEKLIVLGFYCGSPLALLASIVASALAFGWTALAVVPIVLVIWTVNRGLSCVGSSSAWPATFLLAGASTAHLMQMSVDPWVTGFALLCTLALWCDRMLYASATVALRALVMSNPRALDSFADGVSVHWLR